MATEQTRRRERRGNVAMPGTIRHNVTCRSSVAISDLSARGCRIVTTDEGISAGTSLFVRLNHLAPLRATVRWRGQGNMGLEFDQPLYIPVLDHLLDQWPFAMIAELETN